MIMINNDVKTDTILVSAIVLSIWLLVSYIETKEWKFLIGSSIAIAIAMLTKGPIGSMMMPALAIGGHVLLKRQWKSLFDWRWGIMPTLLVIILIPMCIGLYLHYGNQGLGFFFWKQIFGRITGENEWRNDASPLYFTHIFLWSFLPWTLLGIAGIVSEFRNLRTNISRKNSELYLLSGIALVWTALSFSKFKLPHYIFVVYPLIAILAAKFIHQLHTFVHVAWAQLILGVTACLTLAGLLLYSFPNGGRCVPVLLVLICLVAILYFFMSFRTDQIMIPSFLISIAIGIGLNLHFYPQLLPYQANSQVGKWVKEN
ncbi:MAG: 4-amino-4-deoxy-L-arabinose transferase-like glycosyltransferase, partial [Bacteroidia bacterium]|jgi:4-amino-4-deoxy-L-arabinose transferase-like glycosyltransferase